MTAPLRILLVNDDGPPCASSPHIYTFYCELTKRGHQVSVVIPSGQRSWGAMQFSVKDPVSVWYYYPDAATDGRQGEWSPNSMKAKEGPEWVLLGGTPTTCANIGLHNRDLISPHAPSSKPFDLVISGPNFGRNTGLAFCLSSGTLGAALAASLSGVKAIALSYAHFATQPETIKAALDLAREDPAQAAALEAEEQGAAADSPETHVAPATPKRLGQIGSKVAVDLIERLYSNWEPSVGVYALNIPLAWTLLNPSIYWTTMWKNIYPALFKSATQKSLDASTAPQDPPHAPKPTLALSFQPEMTGMLAPPGTEVPGTDVWAIMNGHVSIARLQPSFTEAPSSENFAASAASAPGTDSVDLEARRFRL